MSDITAQKNTSKQCILLLQLKTFNLDCFVPIVPATIRIVNYGLSLNIFQTSVPRLIGRATSVNNIIGVLFVIYLLANIYLYTMKSATIQSTMRVHACRMSQNYSKCVIQRFHFAQVNHHQVSMYCTVFTDFSRISPDSALIGFPNHIYFFEDYHNSYL